MHINEEKLGLKGSRGLKVNMSVSRVEDWCLKLYPKHHTVLPISPGIQPDSDSVKPQAFMIHDYQTKMNTSKN